MNLAAAGAACAVLAWVVGGMLAGGDPASETVAPPVQLEAAPSPSLVPAPATGAATQVSDVREYALAVPELEGLPPDLPAGTPLELWVAWDPPLTKEADVRRLIPRVVYERTIPPTIEGGPHTAVISLPVSRVRDLMYGDRYGALSAAVIRQ